MKFCPTSEPYFGALESIRKLKFCTRQRWCYICWLLKFKHLNVFLFNSIMILLRPPTWNLAEKHKNVKFSIFRAKIIDILIIRSNKGAGLWECVLGLLSWGIFRILNVLHQLSNEFWFFSAPSWHSLRRIKLLLWHLEFLFWIYYLIGWWSRYNIKQKL